MALVRIPFRPQFRQPILSKVKVCTSRPYPMAKAGDHFYAFGKVFEVTAVVEETLGFIKDNLWREEGVSSPDTFIQVWNTIHSKKLYSPTTVVYLHWFNMIEEETVNEKMPA